MDRYLRTQILKDLLKKMVFVTGPRQVGKTFLAKEIMRDFPKPQYFNYDSPDDRRIIQDGSWRLDAGILVFDEIHKMKNWKPFLKGVFDARPTGQAVLVTGSARMETFRQSGESLAGRYFHLRLNPLSPREVRNLWPAQEAVERLNERGGFPEPFLAESEEDARRWRNQYYSDLIREDILDYSRIQEIRAMRFLVELLRDRVGSPLSFSSLAEDLQVAPNTVKKYIHILESLYIVFLVRPYHHRIERALSKMPKLYFYDSGYAKNEAARFENTCALALLKFVQYLYDVEGKSAELHYIRTKEDREVDFAVTIEANMKWLIEAKLSDNVPSPAFHALAARFPKADAIQLVHRLRQEEFLRGIAVASAGRWLSDLPV
jgi:hypothetical protein